jgi:hypothetical protein
MAGKIGNCILISVGHYVLSILWMGENVFWGDVESGVRFGGVV